MDRRPGNLNAALASSDLPVVVLGTPTVGLERSFIDLEGAAAVVAEIRVLQCRDFSVPVCDRVVS